MRHLLPIANRIEERLEAIRIQSLYRDGVLEEAYTCVYLRFRWWLRVVSGGGQTRAEASLEPGLRAFDPRGDAAQSPIGELPPGHSLHSVIGRRLDEVFELVAADDPTQSYGLELELEGERLRLLSIDGASLDLSSGRSELPDELRRRPVLRVFVTGGNASDPK